MYMYHFDVGEPPTLLELGRLRKKNGSPLNFLTRVVPELEEFGKNLFNDPNGDEVKVLMITHKHDPPKVIINAILKKWLDRGGQCTYEYLIKTIKRVSNGDLEALAKDLEESHIPLN